MITHSNDELEGTGHQLDHREYNPRLKPDGRDGPSLVERYSTLRQAWSHLIRKYPWSHWLTLEFPPQMRISEPSIASRHLQGFADSVTRETQGPVPWLAVAERFSDDTIHLHVFLAGTSTISIERLTRRWQRRYGSADIRIYDPALDGAGYSVKEIESERSEVMLSDGFAKALRRLSRRARTTP